MENELTALYEFGALHMVLSDIEWDNLIPPTPQQSPQPFLQAMFHQDPHQDQSQRMLQSIKTTKLHEMTAVPSTLFTRKPQRYTLQPSQQS